MPIFSQSSFFIEPNGPILLAGAVIGSALAIRLIRRLNYTYQQIAWLIIPAWLIGLVFAKASHLANIMLTAANLSDALLPELPWSGHGLPTFLLYGYSSIGGLIGAGLYCGVYCVIHMRSALELANACVVPALLMYAIARIGCAVHGCCYGIEANPPEGSVLSLICVYPQGICRWPLQWMDSILSFILCAILYMVGKGRPASRIRVPFFFVLYAVQRFLLDFLRGDRQPIPGIPLTATQCMCIVAFLIGILLFCSDQMPLFTSSSQRISKQ